jgi:Fimbrial assembly protein (PilN)
MTQNINLYDGGSRKSRTRLGAVTLLYGVGALAVALSLVHVFVQFQVRGLNTELRRTQAMLDAERTEVLKATSQAAARKPDPQLEAEIARLRTEAKQAQEAMAALKGGSFGEQEGFADYMGAFSRQSSEGVWLTGFTVGAGDIEIRGRALGPDLVPAYIQRLNREEVFAGRSFARLEMNRPSAQTGADGKAVETVSFLEFLLATRETGKPSEKAP